MKKWIFYAIAAAVLLFPSKQGTELGKLRPVKLIYSTKEGNALILRTDTGDMGVGLNLRQAVADLKETAPGAIFLDTADYLIITEETRELLPAFVRQMRPSAEVYLTGDALDPSKAAEYLNAHPGTVTLQKIRAGTEDLPKLRVKKGRYRLDP